MSLLVVSCVRAAAPADPAGIEFFERNVRPILVENCYTCHSASAKRLKGELRLDFKAGVEKGGASGAVVVPGDPDKSPLIQAIRYGNPDLQMPPKQRLSDEQVKLLETWVRLGAPFPDDADGDTATKSEAMSVAEGRHFWSFRAPQKSSSPEQLNEWVKTDIDRFILAKLAEQNLSLSPLADKRTLIRRATYDLTGLPPTSAEVDAFEKDASVDALERLIDRLLASPGYGERWGRLWLDVARYADSKGYVFEEERRYAFSYTYRDWVIRALNDDMPYDQFLIHQIASDRLEGADKRHLAALGFLTLGRRFLNNPPDIIDDRIDVVTRGTMGLTVSCARCHDHKYDPIPTADYYSLYGVFASSREPDELPLIDHAEKNAQTEEYEKKLAELQATLEEFRQERYEQILTEERAPQRIAAYVLAAHELKDTPEEKLQPELNTRSLDRWMLRRWKQFVEKQSDLFAAWRVFEAVAAPREPFIVPTLPVHEAAEPALAAKLAEDPPKNIQELSQRYGVYLASRQEEPDSPTLLSREQVLKHLFNEADQNKDRERQQSIDELAVDHPGSPPRAMAMEDKPEPGTPRIFNRGNANNPGEEVPRQFLAILSPDDRKPFTDGSGRLELARAIASRDNPLTARVLVNRIWLHHFGQGLVHTPSDFGTRGELPTHPELLDSLAIRFMDDGWSVKKLHKLIMLSAVYQQRSDDNPAAREIDPENRLLWRMNRRRVDFEQMRDSLLLASGKLDLTMFGRPVDIVSEPFSPRRSMYGFIDRQNLPGMFRTFDLASPDSHSPQRFSTSVPQQALFMLNSGFVIEQARQLAARVEIASSIEPTQRIEAMYRIALGRSPAGNETELALKFVETESAQPPPPAPPPPVWAYGYGEFDEATGRVKDFKPLPHFNGYAWQGGPDLPDGNLGWVRLNAGGGHPGEQTSAVVRRWTSPRDAKISISGKLAHGQSEGDGVRARIVSDRGTVGQWSLHNMQAQTAVDGLAVRQGETIDFIVDCLKTTAHDSFAWNVVIQIPDALVVAGGESAGEQWNSVEQFAGPPGKQFAPLTPWEKYAQVLLQTNEFAFID